ncbi:hypothetical protein GH714_005569 [Hevea brasiliensis]|uniref:NmrA-like domain-containing protein n=1 Tax=Hevea brasiliensis TaxID=3981 RepID=A0A6A6LVI7_HEVBR|nr:hypothetical protein GH714_005569 [Hevea brasiliensis]
MGVTVVHGELDEHDKIVALLGQVDVVISALAYPQRFFPSDFGIEEDRVTPLPPFEAVLEKKRTIRRATEAAGIPFTFVSANCFGSYFINYLLRPREQRHNVDVYGSGEAKAVLNYEEDIAIYTIKAADDPRTLNRVVIYRPEKNIISQFELISLWEKKTALPHPRNIPVAILHSLFVKGDLMSYEVEKDDLEVSKLYPDFEYTTLDRLLDIFLVNPPEPAFAAFE